MAEDGQWRPKGRRKADVRQSRPRRPRAGELVQVDGSPHDWFEGRGPRCADRVRGRRDGGPCESGRLTALRFFEAETTRAYIENAARASGVARPAGDTVLGPPQRAPREPQGAGRTCRRSSRGRTLSIEPIHASAPQAKGAWSGRNGRCRTDCRRRCSCPASTAQGRRTSACRVHGGLQPALRGGAAAGGGRAPSGAARRGELALILSEHHVRRLSRNRSGSSAANTS